MAGARTCGPDLEPLARLYETSPYSTSPEPCPCLPQYDWAVVLKAGLLPDNGCILGSPRPSMGGKSASCENGEWGNLARSGQRNRRGEECRLASQRDEDGRIDERRNIELPERKAK